SLCYGGSLRIVSHDTAIDENLLARTLRQRPVDVLKIVPSHLSALMTGDNPDILPRKCLIVGGEAVDAQLIGRIREMVPGLKIVNHYGPTESTVGVTSYELDEDKPSNVLKRVLKSVPIGKPFNNIRTYILDSEGNQVPMGVPGELYLGGESLARGYYNDSAKTAMSFIPDAFSNEPGARLYQTGDLCLYLPDGEIKYLKRNDSQVKVRGYRVELDDIRNALIEHEEIESAVVVHYHDENLGDVLVAWYVSGWGDEIDADELKTFVGQQLPQYMVPFAFRMLDEIPLNSNGKVNRKALPNPQLKVAYSGITVPPKNDMEKSLAQIWQELLNIDEVCVQTSFAKLGGHSLLAIRLTARIRKQLSLELPLKLIFEMPTIVEQASYLSTIAQLQNDTDQRADSADREEFSF
ncbi:MAG: non-ribosomal peptide synthetase, partial [Algicola sp.]|nr:non-ribosomal peptide synthetase [Algicola sp.]